MSRLAYFAFVAAVPLAAQSPFYTDDTGTTPKGQLHFEFFNEFDSLQHDLYPSLRQNTTNMKLNYGVTDSLELDFDSPYLAIFRSRLTLPNRLNGVGDANLGVKWNFHKESLRVPAFGASFYVEFPTGDSRKQLGSGLVDYALNTMVQKSVTERTKLTGNLGVVFTGNNSTGLVGLQTRGRVYTGGTSVVRRFTGKLSMGMEWIGAISRNFDLGKSQLQFLGGGSYELRPGFQFNFAALGGWFVGSPLLGAQLGFSVDFAPPRLFKHGKTSPQSALRADLLP
ncbi:MAG: transporter [Bryobacteraceae bacterium]